MELKVNAITVPEEVKWNYEELKQEIAERAHDYEVVVYTDDQIKTAKEDRATLNKLKKTLNDERIRLEKEYMKPFNVFKEQVNEVISIIDKPIGIIDKQVKEYEETKKAEKRDQILRYMHTFKLPYEIKLDPFFSDKWLNSTVQIKTAYAEIDEKVSEIQDDLDALEELDEFQDLAIAYYQSTLDLRGSLNEVRRQKDLRAERERIEAERKAKQGAKQEVTPKEEVKEEVKEEEVEREWISFKAHLSAEEAKALKAFFVSNGIEFAAI